MTQIERLQHAAGHGRGFGAAPRPIAAARLRHSSGSAGAAAPGTARPCVEDVRGGQPGHTPARASGRAGWASDGSGLSRTAPLGGTPRAARRPTGLPGIRSSVASDAARCGIACVHVASGPDPVPTAPTRVRAVRVPLPSAQSRDAVRSRRLVARSCPSVSFARRPAKKHARLGYDRFAIVVQLENHPGLEGQVSKALNGYA